MNEEITDQEIWLAVQALGPTITPPQYSNGPWYVSYKNHGFERFTAMDALTAWYNWILQGSTE